jgi:hypothetical protein
MMQAGERKPEMPAPATEANKTPAPPAARQQ